MEQAVDVAAIDAEVEAMLGDLDMPELETTEAVIEDAGEPVVDAEVRIEALDEDIEAAVSDLDMAEAKAEVYDAADAGSVVSVDEVEEAHSAPAPEATTKTVRKSKKADGEATVRVRMDVKDLKPECFVLDMADADADLDANKLAVLAKRPAQKKVAEKFDNLLISAAAGKAPSKFTMDCYRALKAKEAITSAELVAVLTSSEKKSGGATYNIGTARSQAGQIMSLFPALKIATREGNKITLNKGSTLAGVMDSLLAA